MAVLHAAVIGPMQRRECQLGGLTASVGDGDLWRNLDDEQQRSVASGRAEANAGPVLWVASRHLGAKAGPAPRVDGGSAVRRVRFVPTDDRDPLGVSAHTDGSVAK